MIAGSSGSRLPINVAFATTRADGKVVPLYHLYTGGPDDGAFKRAVDDGIVTGKGHDINVVDSGGSKLVIVNVGKQADLTSDDLRMAAGYACGWLRSHTKLPRQAGLFVSQAAIANGEVQLLVEGWELRNDSVKRNPKARQAETAVTLHIVANSRTKGDGLEQQVQRGQLIGKYARWVRHIGNLRASESPPHVLASDIRRLLVGLKGVSYPCGSVLNEAFYEGNDHPHNNRRFGSFLSVAVGSEERPHGVLAHYKCGRPGAKTVAIVGKGVAFDTGGLLRKPGPEAMNDMFLDDLGAEEATALFAFLAECGAPFNLVLMVNFTYNMDGTFPRDIITARNGMLIEVNHTDAEGRLTLIDGNDFVVERFKPDFVIDIATLTGAAMTALGGRVAMFSSDKADQPMSALYDAITKSGIGFWPMPMPFNQASLLDSDEADLVNTDLTKKYGCGTAALFLALALAETNRRCSTRTVLWHMDIAGMMEVGKPKGYQIPGADPMSFIGLAYGLLALAQRRKLLAPLPVKKTK
ncbi:MAG: hypothetical protein HY565_04530 [Candidatus Kerfeldbacteria bacterium]|nr:hypothetical protein [Candidatus Kerfeldbacteria bacterium]